MLRLSIAAVLAASGLALSNEVSAQAAPDVLKAKGCLNCHEADKKKVGPSLKDIIGTTVDLQDGSSAVVDEAYLRESILTSQAKIVKGFQPLMPTFQGLISEENLVALIEHVKSMSPKATTAAAPASAAAESGAATAGKPAGKK